MPPPPPDPDCNQTEEIRAINFKVSLVLGTVSLILLFIMMRIGCKVYKIVKFNDKMMLLMIVFLNFELLCKCFFIF